MIDIIIAALAFLLGSYILSGVEIKNFWQALIVAPSCGCIGILPLVTSLK